MDPEEVKEITGRIFGEVSQIVIKYDGFIEKYAGDAVMAIFGANRSHEDDPVRAVKSAKEIHNIVEFLGPEYEGKIGQPLLMHTGINTGLVVTGELNLERGVHGVAGDTINVAARLSAAATPGDILVDHGTYTRTEGYFQFEDMAPIQLKGKTKSIQVHKYLSVREQPRKIHRLHGLRAELIGREAEISRLTEAVDNLKQRKGAVFSIIGTAGTGSWCAIDGRIQESQDALEEVLTFSQRFGADSVGLPAKLFFGLVTIVKGDISQGLKMMKEVNQKFLENQNKPWYSLAEYLIGKVYLQVAVRKKSVTPSIVLKISAF